MDVFLSFAGKEALKMSGSTPPGVVFQLKEEDEVTRIHFKVYFVGSWRKLQENMPYRKIIVMVS